MALFPNGCGLRMSLELDIILRLLIVFPTAGSEGSAIP